MMQRLCRMNAGPMLPLPAKNRFPEFCKPSVCRMQSISARLRRALSLFVSLHSMVSRQLKV